MKPRQPDWLHTGPLVRLPADLLEAETQDYPPPCEWLTEPRDASPTRADLEDEIAKLRAQLAENGGHRG